MNDQQWNDAIAAYYFNDDAAGHRVYLAVDDDELERIGALAGERPDDARADFLAAMRGAATNPRDPFFVWRKRYEAWRVGTSPRATPPFLSLLALFVLVAEESTAHLGWPFYGPLQAALGADGPRLRQDLAEYELRGFGPVLWQALSVWLDDDLAGTRGLPTAQAPAAGIRCLIGHAYSQVVIRRTELDDLVAFFAYVGLDEAADLDPDDGPRWLFELWRTWVLQGGSTSERLRRLAAGGDADSADVFGRFLFDELLDPSGTAPRAGVPEAGRRVEVSVTLDDWDDNELRFGVVAGPSLVGLRIGENDEDFARRDAGDVVELDVPVTPETIKGFSFPSGDVTLFLRPRSAIQLASRDLGLWVSIADPEPGEELYVLRKKLDRQSAEPPGAVMAKRVRNVPDGWELFRCQTPPGEDRVHAAPNLAGGLRLGRRHDYLFGTPPFVVAPPSHESSICVTVDGTVLAQLGPEGGLAHMPSQLAPGPHAAQVGPVILRFNVLTASPTVEMPYRPRLMRSAMRSESGEVLDFSSIDFATASDGQRSPPTACGVTLNDECSDVDPRLTPLPLEIRYFGAPGLVEDRVVDVPPWTRRVGLPLVGFEYKSRVACRGGRPLGMEFVAWNVEGRWHLGPLRPGPVSGAVEDQASLEWARAVTEIADANPNHPDWDRVADARWADFVARARETLEGEHG